MQLDTIKFFGRTLADYEQFFHFNADDYRDATILDVAAGSSSFTAEACALGLNVMAVDPVYSRNRAGVEAIARMDFAETMRAVRQDSASFALRGMDGIEALEAQRLRALRRFLADYEMGRAQGRYRHGSLPRLPFPSRSFDSVFCGHFLFLYSGFLGHAFHEAALIELMRVARHEVRLYPLVPLEGVLSFSLEETEALAAQEGFEARRISLDYEIFAGAVEMLQLVRRVE